jgi:hypothetical protein
MTGETAMIDPNVIREISDALPFGTTQREPELDEEPTPPSAKVAVATPRSAERQRMPRFIPISPGGRSTTMHRYAQNARSALASVPDPRALPYRR